MNEIKKAVYDGKLSIWNDGECILGDDSPAEDIENFFDGHDYYLLNERGGVYDVFENCEFCYLTSKGEI